jgi:hypothetical protein
VIMRICRVIASAARGDRPARSPRRGLGRADAPRTAAGTDDRESEAGMLVCAQRRVTWGFLTRLRRGLGPRLLARVLLCSAAITLLLTLGQLYVDYRHEVGKIERRLAEIEGSYLRSLGEGLWNLDRRQLELQIAGILRLPAIRFVEVREATERADPLVVSGGQRQAHAAVRRDFALFHTARGVPQRLGVLALEATFDEVYGALRERALVIALSQGATIFLVSCVLLLLTHRLVTRPLTALAGLPATAASPGTSPSASRPPRPCKPRRRSWRTWHGWRRWAS